jgi:uncharacterized protein
MFIRGIFRLLYYAFLAYMAWSVYRMIAGAGKRRTARPAEKSRLTGVMVKDQVCGTYLSKENALRETIGGQERFFCSRECRAKALTGNRSGDKPQ